MGGRRDEDDIRERAARDPQFRERLLADPKSALSQEFDVEIPASVRIRVVEEDTAEVLIVLPSRASEDRMSDSEVEELAGSGSSANWTNCHDCSTPSTCNSGMMTCSGPGCDAVGC